MKVKIVFNVTVKKKTYFGSKNIEWPFQEWPKKGDLIYLSDLEESMGELDYSDEDSKIILRAEKSFGFFGKSFKFNKMQLYITLHFGDE